MRKSGEITVFFSLIMLSICALMAGVLESARTAGARFYLSMASNSALDSVMSGYHKAVWEDYHILMLEAADESRLLREYDIYLGDYLETKDFYPMGLGQSELTNLTYMTDFDGQPLEEEVLAYMKYGILETALSSDIVEQGLRNIKEAGNIKDITTLYGSRSKEAFLLEETLQKMNSSLSRQREYYNDGVSALNSHSGSRFRKAADKLDKELRKMPGLRSKYEKQADKLKAGLEETRLEYGERTEFFQEEVINAMEEETACYGDYINADGARRLEIEALELQSAQNREVIERALERAGEVEDIIDSWDDEEDGSLDESSLWDSVLSVFRRCHIGQMESAHGIKDTEKKKMLEKVQELVNFQILDMVLPADRAVSKGVLQTAGFPSREMEVGTGWDMRDVWKEKGSDLSGAGEALLKNTVMNEYAASHFTNFMSETLNQDDRKEVQYEIEYLLGGKNTDEGNLEAIVGKLLLIREGFNFIHILTDTKKREEANAMAASIAGVTGMAPLVAITAFFIIGVWALAEAVVDVKMLLSGKHVPLVKGNDTWKVDLNNISQFMDKTTDFSQDETAEGFNYETYLKLFLLFQDRKVKCFRFLDVIQMNIKRQQKEFLIKQCAYQLQFTCKSTGRFQLGARSAKAY